MKMISFAYSLERLLIENQNLEELTAIVEYDTSEDEIFSINCIEIEDSLNHFIRKLDISAKSVCYTSYYFPKISFPHLTILRA